MTETPWFLKSIKGQEAHEMAEGGDFIPTGFIGQVQLFHVWRLYADVTPSEAKEEYEVEPDLYRKMGDGYVYLFQNHGEAEAAQSALGLEINPQRMVYVQMPTSTVINFQDEKALDKWAPSIGGEIRNITWRSKYHHQTHLIFLPRLVWAFARSAGWKVPNFDLSDIDMNPNDFDDLANDDLQELLIGNKEVGYEGSKYYEARAALWAALGESNPEVYVPKGTEIMRRGVVQESERATSSDKLSTLLGFYVKDWDPPIWARVKLVADPQVDARSKANNRLTIPVIWELFRDKAEAEAARDEDWAEMNVEPTTTSQEGNFYVPKELESMAEEWQSDIEKAVAEGRDAAAVADEWDVSKRQVERAYESLQN